MFNKAHTFVPQKLVPQSPTIEQIVRLKEAGLVEEAEARRLLAVHHGIGEAPAQPHRNAIDEDD